MVWIGRSSISVPIHQPSPVPSPPVMWHNRCLCSHGLSAHSGAELPNRFPPAAGAMSRHLKQDDELFSSLLTALTYQEASGGARAPSRHHMRARTPPPPAPLLVVMQVPMSVPEAFAMVQALLHALAAVASTGERIPCVRLSRVRVAVRCWRAPRSCGRTFKTSASAPCPSSPPPPTIATSCALCSALRLRRCHPPPVEWASGGSMASVE
jgi:hypothetical protein